MEDYNRYLTLTNSQIADQLDTLVGNTTLSREASMRLRATVGLRAVSTDILAELDGMIESTEEFIADDQFVPNNCRETLDRMIRGPKTEGRLQDLLALEHVRKLYELIFKED